MSKFKRKDVTAQFLQIGLKLVHKGAYGYHWENHQGEPCTAERLDECVAWLDTYRATLNGRLRTLLDSDISDGQKFGLELVYNSRWQPPIRTITEQFEQLQQLARSQDMRLEYNEEGASFILRYGEHSSYGDQMLNTMKKQIKRLISYTTPENTTLSTEENCG